MIKEYAPKSVIPKGNWVDLRVHHHTTAGIAHMHLIVSGYSLV